jgi:hypothetical protein
VGDEWIAQRLEAAKIVIQGIMYPRPIAATGLRRGKRTSVRESAIFKTAQNKHEFQAVTFLVETNPSYASAQEFYVGQSRCADTASTGR